MLFLCTLRIAVVFSIPFSLNLAMFGFLRFLEGLTSLAFYQLSFVTGSKTKPQKISKQTDKQKKNTPKPEKQKTIKPPPTPQGYHTNTNTYLFGLEYTQGIQVIFVPMEIEYFGCKHSGCQTWVGESNLFKESNRINSNEISKSSARSAPALVQRC